MTASRADAIGRLRSAEPVENAVRKEAAKTSAPDDMSELRFARELNPPLDLSSSQELLLILHLRLDLDTARLDAVLQRKRKAQHPVSM